MSISWREIDNLRNVGRANHDTPPESRAESISSGIQEFLNYANRHSFEQRIQRELNRLAGAATRYLRNSSDNQGSW